MLAHMLPEKFIYRSQIGWLHGKIVTEVANLSFYIAALQISAV